MMFITLHLDGSQLVRLGLGLARTGSKAVPLPLWVRTCWELGPCGMTDLCAHSDTSGKGIFPPLTCGPTDEKA